MPVQTIEKKGKSVEEAVKAALDELGCNIEDVSVEVVEEASKRLLGFMGNKPAIVKVSLLEKPETEARKLVENLLQKMNIDYQIERVEWENGVARINIIGQDMGLLIGRKGETLNALQFIAGLMLNRKREEKIRIILDVEDYRKKREETLTALARRIASQVKRSGERVVLEPMNPHERKVIHLALQEDRRIVTNSEGEEPYRYVVIELKK